MDIMTYAASVAYTKKAIAGGGSGGTTDYNALTNKPQINGVELSGNQTAQDLKINYVVDLGEVTSGQQITITEEQMQSFLSDNPPDVKMTLDGREVYIKRFANTETDAYFSGSAISSSVIYSVTMSANGTTAIVNAQISQQLPQSSLADAGKVPAVNKTGDGYELVEISGGGGNKQWKSKTIQLDAEANRIVLLDESEISSAEEIIIRLYAVNPSDAGHEFTGWKDCILDVSGSYICKIVQGLNGTSISTSWCRIIFTNSSLFSISVGGNVPDGYWKTASAGGSEKIGIEKLSELSLYASGFSYFGIETKIGIYWR